MANKAIFKSSNEDNIVLNTYTKKKEIDDYNIKKQFNLDDSQLVSTITLCEDQFEEKQSHKVIVLHGINQKELVKRRKKNKRAKESRKRNRK